MPAHLIFHKGNALALCGALNNDGRLARNSLSLVERLYEINMEKKATRDSYGEALVMLAEKRPDLIGE